MPSSHMGRGHLGAGRQGDLFKNWRLPCLDNVIEAGGDRQRGSMPAVERVKRLRKRTSKRHQHKRERQFKRAAWITAFGVVALLLVILKMKLYTLSN